MAKSSMASIMSGTGSARWRGPRRLRRRHGALVTAAAVIVLAGCGTSSGGSGGPQSAALAVSSSHTLNLAFGADMQVPDPDIFYEIEGNAVVTSVYEGLVKYADNSTTIVPCLAASWTISPSGTQYTFHLRPGVTFHDGTPMTSEDWAFDFARRTGLGATSAQGYMLADVASTETPDPLTFIVNLTQPVSAFMDYMASPYGPKALSATAVKAHEKGVTAANPNGDWAQAWLRTHDAGTGPYQITTFDYGSIYTLAAYPGYWGPKPYYSTVNVHIVPDINTQQDELESGQLSMLLHGLPIAAVKSFKANPDYEVQTFPTQLKAMLDVNPHVGIFQSQAVRSALRQAIDKAQIVADVYDNYTATVSNQVYPEGEFPSNLALDNPTYDPSALKSVLARTPGSKVVSLAYSTDDPTNQRLAEFIESELDADGLTVNIHGVPISQVFDFVSTPASQLPDLLVWTVNPDDSAPDSWVRIFCATVQGANGGLNELQGSVPAADALMNAGLDSNDPATIKADYAQAATDIANSGEWISIANVDDTVVSHAGVTGWYHQPPTADTVVLGALTYKAPTGS
ncbi:MAG TPA: ABC transporter substrate-binding protein [Acidimicrobiales bacterium]|nr:ABC transporter substrate-binding protein [Acidimicrobiales bacterium]